MWLLLRRVWCVRYSLVISGHGRSAEGGIPLENSTRPSRKAVLKPFVSQVVAYLGEKTLDSREAPIQKHDSRVTPRNTKGGIYVRKWFHALVGRLLTPRSYLPPIS